MPKVSVIITNYNHAQYLGKRIESVLAQTYTDYNVIIYDDRSTDNSNEVIEQYRTHPKVEQIIYNETNSGNLYKQWEKGIANATGEWIWIAQSDDYADPAFLETLVNLAESKEDIGIAFCSSYWIGGSGELGPDLSIYQESFFRSGLEEIRITTGRQCTIQNASSAIIRRGLAAEAIKNISDHYRICGDWIFYLRILHCSNIVYTNQRLNSFRWHPDNISNTAINNEKWIAEGLTVINNIDYRQVKYKPREFYLLIKWWGGIILRSSLKKKHNMYATVARALKNYLLKSKL